MAEQAKVLAHPAYRRVPDPLYPLETKEAQAEYRTCGRMLFHAGLLTVEKHRALSSYAGLVDSIRRQLAKGKTIRPYLWESERKARQRLGLDEVDRPVAVPAEAKNKFARNGWACRR